MRDRDDAVRESSLEIVNQWIHLFNTDVHRMVDEVYSDDFRLVIPGLVDVTGKGRLHELEDQVLTAAPDRRGTILSSALTDDHTIVHGELKGSDPDTGREWTTYWCSFLTLREGQVTSDLSYIDPSAWPGFRTRNA
ncbi:SnoaL-like protein [Streptomyces sp. BK208]|uniref:nuclear transport factor 2 family protein n=1 Tax=Streptomyces sp. BK208 TaxID=2512150 RepID=UPI00106101AD|nr:nuclear transport factor 2 family protein [Streptomyces sp. BK208]TDT31627.1 SnoaL-like protein [Streptomyces sp. BK208]